MKPFDYYSKHQTHYPNREDYTDVYVYDKGKVIWEGSESSYKELIKTNQSLHNKCVVQKVLNEEEYRKQQQKYGAESHKLHDEFVNDLFETFGVQDNPKRHKAFDLAYERGHSYGYEEVYNVFYDLVELIKD